MPHTLPELPYALDALSPLMSAETLRFHHGKHHRAYVEKLESLVKGTRYEETTLQEMIRSASGPLFDHAAQHFNHSFFWQCLRPAGGPGPQGDLHVAIERGWGSLDRFREEFSARALGLFGSGWCWLVAGREGSLAVEPLKDAGCPLAHGRTPLLTLDVWEHAYYIDYRSSRKRYVEAFWSLANWEHAESQLRLHAKTSARSTIMPAVAAHR